jgi:serine/threonine protein phosphatase 1
MRLFPSFSFRRGRDQTPEPESFEAALLPEVPLYVIGDIHGQSNAMMRLLDRIDASIGQREHDEARLIFVGDYIDRGEFSQEVLAALVELTAAFPETVTALMGNHEKMMLDFLDRPEERGSRWLRNGGLQTLASFGIGGVTAGSRDEAMLRARDEFADAVPDDWVAWMRALPLQTRSGNVHIVHAAADPDLPMDEQPERTLLWGSAAFLRQPRLDGIWVVHGHTVVDRPEARAGRIAVDTGAVFSGVLTAALIEPGGASFLTS